MEQVEISNAAKEVLCLCEYFDSEISMKDTRELFIKVKGTSKHIKYYSKYRQ